MADTYRSWLQNQYNMGGGTNYANALNFMGDDGGIDMPKLSAYNDSLTTGSKLYGSTPAQIIDPNSLYSLYDAYLKRDSGAKLGAFDTNSSTSGPTYDAAAAADEQAYWDDQLRNADTQLGRIGTQRDAGYQNIDNSYNNSFTTLTGQKGRAETDYTTRREGTIGDNQIAKANINRGVRNQNTSLNRLLGSAGAGSSSAAKIVAPYASALMGNTQREAVNRDYSQNLSALDTNWKRAEEDFGTAFDDLLNQKNTRRQELDAGLAQTEATLQEQKAAAAQARAQAGGASYTTARAARAPYESRIKDLIGTIDRLGVNPNIAARQVDVTRPDLKAYTYDRYGAPTAGSNVNQNLAGNVGSFWTLLGGDKDKERNQLAVA